MTNHPIKLDHGELTLVADLPPEAPGRPGVRRIAVIRTDAAGFKLVATPSQRAPRGQ
jgi:hypothetical protein